MTLERHQSEDVTGTIFGSLLEELWGQPRLSLIQRVTPPPAEEFRRDYAWLSYPVILQGLVPVELTDQAEALLRLIAALPGHLVTARCEAYSNPSDYVGRRPTKTLTLEAFLEELQRRDQPRDPPYLANLELNGSAAQRLSLTPPPYYPGIDLRSPRLWLGPAGAITPLHKDGSDNFSIHVFGRKKWIVFPVRDYPFLYMSQPDKHSFPGFSCSRVDVRAPDYEQFPLFRRACQIEFEVDAGEVLYLPAGWSHYVETLSPSMMVNYWVDNRRRPPAFLERDGCARRTQTSAGNNAGGHSGLQQSPDA